MISNKLYASRGTRVSPHLPVYSRSTPPKKHHCTTTCRITPNGELSPHLRANESPLFEVKLKKGVVELIQELRGLKHGSIGLVQESPRIEKQPRRPSHRAFQTCY
ncbi:hypothetical protein MLD38_011926 [Melastoma candidum]|uniref:Uncharacterized protein n=1 Tax=Melastoma candidum TaxID=119954 RepID=A0ACB9R4Q0_9MYRT|nr:hypothetical protein MLD38_011926 [Melastoma candidum]